MVLGRRPLPGSWRDGFHHDLSAGTRQGHLETYERHLFGATGMVGQGVLRECLLDSAVHLVKTIGRTATGIEHPKLREVVHENLWYDYEHVTYGITMAAAECLVRLNPQMTFVYVLRRRHRQFRTRANNVGAGQGQDRERTAAPAVQGCLYVPPGFIEPLHGAQSRTAAYRRLYLLAKPLVPILRWAFPDSC
jgi:hypothetical protein